MFVKLNFINEKVRKYNKTIDQCRKEFPEYNFRKVYEVSDAFDIYTDFCKKLKKYNSDIISIQDDYRDDIDNVYISELNADHKMEQLTDYKALLKTDSPIYWYNYGVADNASQVLDYFDELYKKYTDYMKDKNFVITLCPIFREDEPEYGGWRWHKWGQYIGKFDYQCEYLHDEVGIDYVYVFNIYEVEKTC